MTAFGDAVDLDENEWTKKDIYACWQRPVNERFEYYPQEYDSNIER